jgi:hypothetical protein
MIDIPVDKLLDRAEVAEILQVSKESIKYRLCGTECLVEIRYTGKVLFNPHQVSLHRAYLWAGENCEGRCKSALKLPEPDSKTTLRRKKKQ